MFQVTQKTKDETKRNRKISKRASRETQERQKNPRQDLDQQTEEYTICVKQHKVHSPDAVNIGDHVVFDRLLYEHHGIITNKKNRIKFEVTEATKNGTIKINRKWKRFDFRKGISVVWYSSRFSYMDTVSRAIEIYDKSTKYPDLYKYNLFTNNCEHFATFCATGAMLSLQVVQLAPFFLYPSVRRVKIKSKSDVKKGDIISFFDKVSNVWHNVLVLKTETRTMNEDMTCFVADKTLSFGKIKIEKKNIKVQFDQEQFVKLEFTKQVQGSEMWEFFTNDFSPCQVDAKS